LFDVDSLITVSIISVYLQLIGSSLTDDVDAVDAFALNVLTCVPHSADTGIDPIAFATKLSLSWSWHSFFDQDAQKCENYLCMRELACVKVLRECQLKGTRVPVLR
jgi:hypothetical protein